MARAISFRPSPRELGQRLVQLLSDKSIRDVRACKMCSGATDSWAIQFDSVLRILLGTWHCRFCDHNAPVSRFRKIYRECFHKSWPCSREANCRRTQRNTQPAYTVRGEFSWNDDACPTITDGRREASARANLDSCPVERSCEGEESSWELP